MTVEEIKHELKMPCYDFLRNSEHLGDKTILIGLGGSYAYGTNTEASDIDIRGIAIRSKREIILGEDFEQVEDTTTDTVIYSLKKMLPLLYNCNPNAVEILGLNEEHYIKLTKIGKILLENRKLFLSKKAISSFGGYANQQLRRLDNKSQRELSPLEQHRHILNSLEGAKTDLCKKYKIDPDNITFFIDETNGEAPIKININLRDFELNKLISIQQSLNNVLNDYKKLGKRNQNAMIHNKLGKHMMHLVRLYYMCFDILEKKEINTYRKDEHDLLMAIRNGIYLDGNNQPSKDFYDFREKLEARLKYAADNTDLPEKPDMTKIKELHYTINDIICKNNQN